VLDTAFCLVLLFLPVFTMLSEDVCPSVRLFVTVTRRYCVKTAKFYHQTFHRRVATPFQFFRVKRCDNTSTATP